MLIKKLKRFDHSEEINSPLFTFLNYDETKKKNFPKRPYFQLAAFDPGVVNTGCRIERRDKNSTTVTTIAQKLLTSGKTGQKDHYFLTMANHIYSMAKDLYECDYILIESQLTTNPEACRMAQHIISTVLGISREGRALVVEVSPVIKSRTFNIHGLKGRELKKWAIEEASKILTSRNDHVGLDFINKSKKKDDHGDVVLYCEAWSKIALPLSKK